MFTLSNRVKVAVAVATGVSATVGLALVGRRLCSSVSHHMLTRSLEAQAIVDKMIIKVAKTEEQSTELVKYILQDMKNERILGFDCEWVQIDKRRPVALLQLASLSGLCVLFQLCLLPEVPKPLKDLLEDPSILKVGLDPLIDANYLRVDYSINVVGTFDIRHLSQTFPKMGLASLAKRELDLSLPKSKSIRTSNWEDSDLQPHQLRYAALDALASVLVFYHLVLKTVQLPFFASKEHSWNLINEHCQQLIDIRFKEKPYPIDNVNKRTTHSHPLQRKEHGIPNETIHNTPNKKSFRAYSSRKAPLYHNCLLLAPDGEALCTCDIKKADWYVSQGLASVDSVDPYKVRLLFEPSGRASSVSGQYYVQEKENQCVVCGSKDSFLRKKVVPHEYRKYFPNAMKKHQSHDVLLLCVSCHLKSNISDLALRQELGKKCGAPLDSEANTKITEDYKRKQLRSAARALMKADGQLPEMRRKELTSIIMESYPEVTPQLLDQLKDLDVRVVNEDYIPHGVKVVEYFAKQGVDGLQNFERLWRKHFLETMKPLNLPPLWSVDHNHENTSRYHIDSSFIQGINNSVRV